MGKTGLVVDWLHCFGRQVIITCGGEGGRGLRPTGLCAKDRDSAGASGDDGCASW